MLFLVNCEVIKSYAMNDDDVRFERNHIVEAESNKEACNKVQNHYELMNEDYSFHYIVNINYCNPIIS